MKQKIKRGSPAHDPLFYAMFGGLLVCLCQAPQSIAWICDSSAPHTVSSAFFYRPIFTATVQVTASLVFIFFLLSFPSLFVFSFYSSVLILFRSLLHRLRTLLCMCCHVAHITVHVLPCCAHYCACVAMLRTLLCMCCHVAHITVHVLPCYAHYCACVAMLRTLLCMCCHVTHTTVQWSREGYSREEKGGRR
jgi:hypothetical protein